MKRSWRIWRLTSGIFIAAGWLLGTCLTGLLALQAALPTLRAAGHDPTPLFAMPLVLGGLTLFLVLTGILRGVLNEFKPDYRLWALQGANSRQLSELMAVQLGLMGTLGSAAGWLVAVSMVGGTYHWLQGWLGTSWLPSVPFSPTLTSAALTVGSVALVSGTSGFVHTHRLLGPTNHGHAGWQRVIHWLRLVLVVASLWGLGRVFFQGRELSGNGVFVAMAWLIVLQLALQRVTCEYVIRLLRLSLQFQRVPLLNVAYWQIRRNQVGVASALNPLLITQTILTGILLALFGFQSGPVDVANVIVSLLVYVGAPILMVFVNSATLMLLASRHQAANFDQFSWSGFQPADLVKERLGESVIVALTFLLGALIINGVLYGALVASGGTHFARALGLALLIPAMGASVVGLFVGMVNEWQVWRWQGQPSE